MGVGHTDKESAQHFWLWKTQFFKIVLLMRFEPPVFGSRVPNWDTIVTHNCECKVGWLLANRGHFWLAQSQRRKRCCQHQTLRTLCFHLRVATYVTYWSGFLGSLKHCYLVAEVVVGLVFDPPDLEQPAVAFCLKCRNPLLQICCQCQCPTLQFGTKAVVLAPPYSAVGYCGCRN